ncbi:hypothetical protein MNV49_003325 [Pseudohyphozyma bogoriensis]|nr:hypothetical protein MNV49_003325 [Pseudohyphozyma bogoriensis]
MSTIARSLNASALGRRAASTSTAHTSTPSPTSVVRSALVQYGPQTTRTLHDTLHTSFSPLPARPPPAHFLSGARRQQQQPPAFSDRASSAAGGASKTFPGEEENSQGSWTMNYLKHRVLKGMEDRGEVIKLTRSAWDKLNPAEAGVVGEGEEKAKDVKGKSGAKASEHVWVSMEVYRQKKAESRAWREQDSSARREVREQEAERSLKEGYGL